MAKFFSQIVAGALGLWIAALLVPGVVVRAYPNSKFFGFQLQEQWQVVIALGIVIGLLNYFLLPILKTLSLPFEILTLGLFNIAINMLIVWMLDVMFDEFSAPFFLPLLYTAITVWASNTLVIFLLKNKH